MFSKSMFVGSAFVIVLVVLGSLAEFYYGKQLQYRKTGIQDIMSNPIGYDNNRIITRGLVVKNVGSFFLGKFIIFMR